MSRPPRQPLPKRGSPARGILDRVVLDGHMVAWNDEDAEAVRDELKAYAGGDFLVEPFQWVHSAIRGEADTLAERRPELAQVLRDHGSSPTTAAELIDASEAMAPEVREAGVQALAAAADAFGPDRGRKAAEVAAAETVVERIADWLESGDSGLEKLLAKTARDLPWWGPDWEETERRRGQLAERLRKVRQKAEASR